MKTQEVLSRVLEPRGQGECSFIVPGSKPPASTFLCNIFSIQCMGQGGPCPDNHMVNEEVLQQL